MSTDAALTALEKNMEPQISAIQSRPDSSTSIEQHGVDVIPDQDRSSKPSDLFFVFLGSQMCFGIIVIGSLPVTFGLGFWDSLSSITVGLLFGSFFFSLLAPFGSRTGTSGAVASGAHFGVSGRLIGTLIAIFTGLGFYALTVWTGGEAIAAAGVRLAGWTMSNNLMAGGAAIICLLTIIAAIYGHALIVATEKIVSYGVGIALLIVGLSLLPSFHPSYAGGTYLLHSFWPTWFLATAVSAALPISYSIFLNDYSRYIPIGTNAKSLTWAAGGGIFVGCWIALAFAAAITSIFKTSSTPFVSGLVDLSAPWAVVLIVLVGIIGSQPQGSLCLYGSGLGLQTIFPKLNRIAATIVLSLVGLGVVFFGIYGVNMTNMMIAFLALDQCALAPWLAINLIGYRYITRGKYVTSDLFAFVEHSSGGNTYRYSNGWNINALLAWAVGFIVGLMFVQTEFFSGPLSTLAGGVSLDWIFAGSAAALVYYMSERRSGRVAPSPA
jgi:purine-cytosine permease-like protein